MHWCLQMPLGLKNAPGSFQRTRCAVLISKVKYKFVLLYLTDVIISLTSTKEHLDNIWTVIGLLPKPDVAFEPKRCFFFQDRIYFLRHIIWPGKLGVWTIATNAIRELQNPMNMTDLKSFLVLWNVSCRLLELCTHSCSVNRKLGRVRLAMLQD